jgi:hypothetical protein
LEVGPTGVVLARRRDFLQEDLCGFLQASICYLVEVETESIGDGCYVPKQVSQFLFHSSCEPYGRMTLTEPLLRLTDHRPGLTGEAVQDNLEPPIGILRLVRRRGTLSELVEVHAYRLSVCPVG